MIGADELVGYLRKDWRINPANKLIADRVYVCPTEDWFFGEFARSLGVFLRAMGLAGFVPEGNDCDDFARAGGLLAALLHLRSGGARGRALAIGEFWYFRNGDQLDEHGVVIARLRSGRPVFMEPQTRRRVELRKEEMVSCTGLRF